MGDDLFCLHLPEQRMDERVGHRVCNALNPHYLRDIRQNLMPTIQHTDFAGFMLMHMRRKLCADKIPVRAAGTEIILDDPLPKIFMRYRRRIIHTHGSGALQLGCAGGWHNAVNHRIREGALPIDPGCEIRIAQPRKTDNAQFNTDTSGALAGTEALIASLGESNPVLKSLLDNALDEIRAAGASGRRLLERNDFEIMMTDALVDNDVMTFYGPDGIPGVTVGSCEARIRHSSSLKKTPPLNSRSREDTDRVNLFCRRSARRPSETPTAPIRACAVRSKRNSNT